VKSKSTGVCYKIEFWCILLRLILLNLSSLFYSGTVDEEKNYYTELEKAEEDVEEFLLEG